MTIARLTDLPLAELKARGYFRTSRKYRLAARIDRPDWLRAMLRVSSQTITDLVRERGLDGLGQHYRTSFSADVVELREDRMDEFLQLERSQWADSIYRPAPDDLIPEAWTNDDHKAARQLISVLWPGLRLRSDDSVFTSATPTQEK